MGSAVGGCLEASPVKGEWCDVDADDGRTAGAHFDCSDAGNDSRHADGDEELVRSGVDLLEDILAADVSAGRTRSAEEADEHDEECVDAKLHRCTLRIRRPKLNPIQVPMEP
jgi:hypothetical protein